MFTYCICMELITSLPEVGSASAAVSLSNYL